MMTAWFVEQILLLINIYLLWTTFLIDYIADIVYNYLYYILLDNKMDDDIDNPKVKGLDSEEEINYDEIDLEKNDEEDQLVDKQ